MKAIVLTGHSRGLGKAIHDLLIKNIDSAQVLVFLGRELVQSSNKSIHYIYCDLTKLDDFNTFELLECLDSVDEITFVNNAGLVEPISSLRDLNLGSFEDSVNVNFLSPVKLIKILNQAGTNLRVINISSGASKKAIPFWGAYCSSKAAIGSFLDVCSLETDIECINYDPGVMDTDMQKDIRHRAEEYTELSGFKDLHSNGVLRSADDVAIAVCELI